MCEICQEETMKQQPQQQPEAFKGGFDPVTGLGPTFINLRSLKRSVAAPRDGVTKLMNPTAQYHYTSV